MNENNKARLLRAQVSNVLGITLAEVKFDKNGGLTVVGGDNGAGKSSLLDALRWALDGSKPKGKALLHHGEKKGLVELELDGEVVEVKRSVTEKGDYLKVTGPDGTDIKSPAKVLKALTGTFGIDPTEFLLLNDKDRAARVQSVMGVDFSDLDAEHKTVFGERTITNRLLRDAEGALKNLPHVDGPSEVVSISELTEQLQQAVDRKTERNGREAELRKLRGDNNTLKAEMEALEIKLAGLREKREALIEKGKELAEMVAKDEEDSEREREEGKDVESIRAQLRDSEEINKRVQDAKKREEAEEKVRQLRAESKDKEKALDDIAQKRAARIAEAPLSIPGIDIRDGVVHYNDKPFTEASDGQQLRTAFEIAAAGSPDLKVMFLRNGSFLDDKNRQAVAELARERGYTVVMEVVGTSGIDVLVENGATK